MKHFAFLTLALVLTPVARAEEPKTFADGTHGKGKLTHIDSVPVLVMKGTPEEMGAQFGKLAIAGAPDITGLHEQFLADIGKTKTYKFALEPLARKLKPNFPKHVAAEVEAAAKASGRDEGLLLFANTV
ncbi:MAG: hypothetical protein K2V38_09635, partial [Gemmataceae bacterium]|nr:hypothetical protein [Gemmataceae bacterium]